MPPAFENVPVKPGEVLAGKYRVERVLGVGGMGVVVAARHLELRRPVALKFMLEHALEDQELVGRFLREARAAVRLASEHSVRVLDVGRLKGGAPFMVMELLAGKDLGVLLQERGPLPVPEAVDYVLQASVAVAEAHALGIVHRDLKPRNLFLTHRIDGTPLVKVLDFGIAKATEALAVSSLTATTGVIGSPQYMSPEQMRASKDVDPRSDVWSLGVTLFELLTRELPFGGDSVMDLCANVLTGRPRDVRGVRPDLPPGIGAVVARCLERERERRFGNVADFAYALEPFGSHASAGAGARIEAVLRARPTVDALGEAAATDEAVDGAHEGRTVSAWGSGPRSDGRRGWTVGLAVGLGLVLLTAQTGIVYAVHKHAKIAADAATASATPSPTATATPAATPTPTPTPTPTATTTTTATATTTTTTTATATATESAAASSSSKARPRSTGVRPAASADPKKASRSF